MWKNITIIVLALIITTNIARSNMTYYPPNEDFKNAVRQALDEMLPEKTLDLIWKKTFHWLTLFEGVDNANNGFVNNIVGTGTIVYSGNDLILTTSAAANDITETRKEPSWQGLVTFSQRSFMRSSLVINSTTNQEIYIKVGRFDTQGYGFKVTNATLAGTTHSGSAESTVNLQALSTGTAYQLEARYLPSKGVIFFVDGIEKGSLSTNLPSPAVTVNSYIMTLRVKTTTTAARNMQVSHFEYLQARNILK